MFGDSGQLRLRRTPRSLILEYIESYYTVSINVVRLKGQPWSTRPMGKIGFCKKKKKRKTYFTQAVR